MLELGGVMVVDIISERDNEMVSVVDLVEVISVIGSIAKVNAHYEYNTILYTNLLWLMHLNQFLVH